MVALRKGEIHTCKHTTPFDLLDTHFSLFPPPPLFSHTQMRETIYQTTPFLPPFLSLGYIYCANILPQGEGGREGPTLSLFFVFCYSFGKFGKAEGKQQS